MDIKRMLTQKTRNQYWIFFSILVLLALFTMFCNGPSSSYSGFDFFFHYRRLDVLIDALRHSSYPVYIDYSNVEGYGYFVKGFYPDLILLPFAFIGLFTSTYFAYDFMIFTMTILCGVLMYHTIQVIYKSRYAAVISSLLYTFSVYRLYDFYHRGALSEGLSFTFLPIVFLGLYHIIKGDYRKWYILAIGYALLIYTHTIASVLMFVTLLIILIVYYKSLIAEPKRLVFLFIAGLVTILITAYYIFPVWEQLNSNSFYLDSRRPGGGAGYGKVGFDLILWGLVSGIAYPDKFLWSGVGIVLILVIVLRLLIKKNKNTLLRSVDIGVIIGICFIVATSRIFPWGRFPFNILSFIQYPWRLYEFVTFFFAIAGGYYISLLLIKQRQRVIGICVIILFTMSTTYIHSENFKDLYPKKSGESRVTSEQPHYGNRYHTIGGEYFPSGLPDIEYILGRGELVEGNSVDTDISGLKREYNLTSFNVNLSRPDTLIVPVLYYYGYEATLNGEKVDIYQNSDGLIAVPLTKSGEVQIGYQGTFLQRFTFYFSLICMLLLIGYALWSHKKIRNEINR